MTHNPAFTDIQIPHELAQAVISANQFIGADQGLEEIIVALLKEYVSGAFSDDDQQHEVLDAIITINNETECERCGKQTEDQFALGDLQGGEVTLVCRWCASAWMESWCGGDVQRLERALGLELDDENNEGIEQ